MSYDSLLIHAVTIVRAGTTVDRYKNTVPDWTNATEVETRGRLAQRSRAENLDGRDAEITSWRLFLPADADIEADDRVRVDGVTYDVAGPPYHAPSSRPNHHVECDLSLAEG